jgi:hypothetical protein
MEGKRRMFKSTEGPEVDFESMSTESPSLRKSPGRRHWKISSQKVEESRDSESEAPKGFLFYSESELADQKLSFHKKRMPEEKKPVKQTSSAFLQSYGESLDPHGYLFYSDSELVDQKLSIDKKKIQDSPSHRKV